MLVTLFLTLSLISPPPQVRVLLVNAEAVTLDFPADSGILEAEGVRLPARISVRDGGILFENVCSGETILDSPLILSPSEAGLWSVNDALYRGSLTIKAAGNQIRVVNTLNVETYLKGVVPAEMGPKVYPALQALKAQAVAARSYVFVQLRHPLDADYDICAGPACQVYKGAGAERPLSNRAVEETEGVILTWRGSPVATFYTATCGGHTTSGNALFHTGASRAFIAVPCFPLPSYHLESQPGSSSPLAAAAAYILTPTIREGLARYLKTDPDHLCNLLNRTFGFESSSCESLGSLPIFHDPPFAPWEGSGAGLGEIAGVLLMKAGEIVPVRGRVEAIETGYLHLLDSPLPYCLDHPPLYLRMGNSITPVGSLTIHPGDRIEGLTWEGRILSLILRPPYDPDTADGTAGMSRWLRFRTWDEIGKNCKLSGVSSLKVLRRTPEGRVIRLEIIGSKGKKILEGLAVRFKLGLPEMLFTMMQTDSGVFFYGRGWGHGVGMCQEGAFGMAVAGYDYLDILRTYYPTLRPAHW